MKGCILALAAVATLTAGLVTTANAVEFGMGPNGVYVGPDRHRYHEESYRDYGGSCRVVISHRTNRYGEDVLVRRRICD